MKYKICFSCLLIAAIASFCEGSLHIKRCDFAAVGLVDTNLNLSPNVLNFVA